jgi:hypothetical protein
LAANEKQALRTIDPAFWDRQLSTKDQHGSRVDLALIYQPEPNWNFLGLVKRILAPKAAMERIKSVVGPGIPVLPVQRELDAASKVS